jgi:tRNA1(Val) A37 N6-methylase TrmN6
LLDILSLMRKHRLEPKRLRFVYPKPGREANTILIEGIKDGKPDLKILPPLYVYDEQNKYSREVYDMLFGKNEDKD